MKTEFRARVMPRHSTAYKHAMRIFPALTSPPRLLYLWSSFRVGRHHRCLQPSKPTIRAAQRAP